MPISLERLCEMRTVTLPNDDRYRFEWLEPFTLFEIFKLRSESLEDRDYLLKSLDLMIEDPDPTTVKLSQLADDELVDLVNRYLNLDAVRNPRSHSAKYPLVLDSVSHAQRELDQYLDEEAKRVKDSSKEVMDSFNRIAMNFGGMRDSFNILPMRGYLDAIQCLNTHELLPERIQKSLISFHPTALDAIRVQNQGWADSWISAQNNLITMYRDIFDASQSVRDSVSATIRAVSRIDLSSVIRDWELTLSQNVIEWAEDIQEEYRSGFLVESNLQFLSDLSDQAITEIVDDALDIPKQQQAAHITRRLFKHTSQPEFIDSVLQEVEASGRAKNRRAILESVHSAHTNRQFLLTISTLLAQLEGLTVHFLAEMGFVKWDRRKKKWYETDPDTGEYLQKVVHKNGKETQDRILLKGLGDLSKFIPKMDNNPLPNTFPHVRDLMPQFRNQVLHGTMTNYGSARRSSMLLLMVQIIGQQLRALETSNQLANAKP